MSETIHARSLTHEGSSTKLEYIESYPLVAGGYEEKRVVKAAIGDRAISLIQRPYDENYIAMWQAFRSAGMPAVPTLRVLEDDNNPGLLVTDIKADGSEVYGKGLWRVLDSEWQRERSRPEIDPLFMQLTHPDHFSAIQSRVHEYTAIADDNRLRLPYDDPFELHVHPDGTWDLVILDLKYGDALSPNGRLEEAKQYNARSAQDFLRYLTHIRDHFTTQNQSKMKRLGQFIRRVVSS